MQRGFQGQAGRNTVWPKVIDDVLYNPGMGFTTMRAFDGDVPGYPRSTLSYWRWYWEEIEPENGAFRWDVIDGTLETARSRGQRVAIRLMPANGDLGAPRWYRDLGVAGFEYVPEANVGSEKKNWMPDHNDPNYLKYMGRLVENFGRRYDGHPDVDHVDIGSLGHWGEWHFAFVKPRPTVRPEVRRALVDIYLDHFKKTPLVMLIGGGEDLAYAVSRGAGWRAGCLGDLGYWGPHWNHMKDRYQQALDEAGANEAWRRAPVALEACGVMQKWADEGYDVEFIFNEALRWRCSIFNNKSSPIPPRWWGATERFLKRMGYRLVLRHVTHPLKVRAGEGLRIDSEWENVGVAPPYRGYVIALELRPPSRRTTEGAVRFTSDADVRAWLPGRYEVCFAHQVPPDLKPGRYLLALALLDPHTGRPAVHLAVEGRDSQGWYGLSEIEIGER